MSEPNEKILKRAVITDEEAAQVTGGDISVTECPICHGFHETGINACPFHPGLDTSKCVLCGSTDHKAEECPNVIFCLGD